MTTLLAAALLVVSVDGLDQRYLVKEGESSRDVTWPSHTSILTGAEAWDHDILSSHRPAVFVHPADLDAEAHGNGPFAPQANAVVERTDELKGGHFVLVSDCGFERASKSVNLAYAAARDNVNGIQPRGGFAIADSPPAAAWLRALSPEHGIGREIPAEEIARFAPPWKGKSIFEPAPGVWFGPGNDTPHETGNHGHWPTRYRPVYAAWDPGIRPARLPEMRIAEIAGRLAGLLRVKIKER